MKTVALVTALESRHLDEDLPPLESALRARGVEPVIAAWDDPAVDWKSFSLAVVRSTWNYVTRRDEFLSWAARVAAVTRLANPPDILRWNTDKRYLKELGPSVVPTTFIDASDPIVLPSNGDFVVKPAVSAGSIDTARYSPRDAEAARAHVRKLQDQRRTVMVQPYMRAVDEGGETAMIYFAGQFSHAIRKGPMLKSDMELVEGLYFKEDIRPRDPTPAEREVADRIVSLAPNPLLYARIDLVPGPEGPLLLEFEATEPSLFFKFSKGAADRFARAILAIP
jgi:glutathione synthase/RimK-type ligase-like ATP-grasp enzyme